MTDIRPVQTDTASLNAYRVLFETCFPGAEHLDELYLRWLYHENPEGKVVGFDSWDNDKLCAHYACIPVSVEVFGNLRRALLSLNTATHPEYQGRGLFTKLAERVYEAANNAGYECVYGIANANSTPGFTRKLGFTCVGPLDAKVGVGRVVRSPESGGSSRSGDLAFRRLWTPEAIHWRFENPHNPIAARTNDEGWILASASARRLGIRAYGEIPPIGRIISPPNSGIELGLRLFLGAVPAWQKMSAAYVTIPKALRPSPLNLIFRNLGADTPTPSSAGVRISFLDFDAY